jgi:hypothetical protein
MFDALSERLRRTLGALTGRGRVTESDVDAAMREVRLALLEADVNFKVVRDFVARVRERAVGAEILESLTAGQQVVAIVHAELTALLTAGDRVFHLSGSPAVVALVGLQGSGKTTTAAKLGRHVVKLGRRPLLVAARPPPTSSRHSVPSSACPSTAHLSGPRSSTSSVPASRPRAARHATSSSSIPRGGSRSTTRSWQSWPRSPRPANRPRRSSSSMR